MKKKKAKHTSNISELGAMATGDGDLELIIHSHAEFFDHLVELIPAKFYLPNEDAESKTWYQGLSKSAKASLKQQTKQNLKVARRKRFDMDKEQTTTLDLMQQQKNENADNVEETNIAGTSEPSVTYEELREKLRKKIDLLKGNRGENKSIEKKVKNDVKKRKRDTESSSGGENSRRNENEEEVMEYGKLRIGDEKEKKKKIVSKDKELENAKRLKEMKKENSNVGKRETWKAAVNRAEGMKVHDNPRMIKDSMKREKRKKEKSAEKWKARVEIQERMKNERQDKRRQNITARINENRTRKIAKREKKLLRPGFEGRKEGYITNE